MNRALDGLTSDILVRIDGNFVHTMHIFVYTRQQLRGASGQAASRGRPGGQRMNDFAEVWW